MFPTLSFSCWVLGNTDCLAFHSNARVVSASSILSPKISCKSLRKDDITQIFSLTVSTTETCEINQWLQFLRLKQLHPVSIFTPNWITPKATMCPTPFITHSTVSSYRRASSLGSLDSQQNGSAEHSVRLILKGWEVRTCASLNVVGKPLRFHFFSFAGCLPQPLPLFLSLTSPLLCCSCCLWQSTGKQHWASSSSHMPLHLLP